MTSALQPGPPGDAVCESLCQSTGKVFPKELLCYQAGDPTSALAASGSCGVPAPAASLPPACVAVACAPNSAARCREAAAGRGSNAASEDSACSAAASVAVVAQAPCRPAARLQIQQLLLLTEQCRPVLPIFVAE